MRYIFLGSIVILVVTAFLLVKPNQKEVYDLIIRQGNVYDGSGDASFVGDLAIQGDTIARIGDLTNAIGKSEIDASGLAVTPGFINMLSWSERSLLMDGRSMSDIKQGVTLEIFGEGESPGPVKRKVLNVDSLWTNLDGYFKYLMKKGVSPNVASFVGATTIRIHQVGRDDRAATVQELENMKRLVREAMEQGAMGLGSSLIYAPATYASTEELIELSKVVAFYGGIYITHMRSEGDFILKALNETFTIAREANVHAEIYHLKINLSRNWNKIDTILARIDSARKTGLKITANNYPYIASATGLTARLPTWVQDGGAIPMRKRLRDPAIRKKVLHDMREGIPYKNSDAKDVMLLGFRLDTLNTLYRWKRLDEVARLMGKDSDEAVIELVLKDKSPIAAVYYQQTEDNIRKIIQQPYVSFGSDAASMSELEIFNDWGAHPRSYGTFARVFAKYVREEKLLSLEEAVHRMTSLPASNLKIEKRGSLKQGYYADIAIFDADSIQDHATFEDAKQYATGMAHVFINGVHVLKDGEHTGAKPGRVVRGPGWKGL